MIWRMGVALADLLGTVGTVGTVGMKVVLTRRGGSPPDTNERGARWPASGRSAHVAGRNIRIDCGLTRSP